MLNHLSAKLQKILRDLKGEGHLSEGHIESSMREIRMVLLEADVHFKVTRDFVASVKEKALGREVFRSLTPGHQVVKIVRDELSSLLGSQSSSIKLSNDSVDVILLVGPQGSGKTTTTGKIARWLISEGHSTLLVSTDVYRPAAMEQLATIARDIEVPIYKREVGSAIELARQSLQQARNKGFSVLLVDTAGRLHTDEQLIQELEEIKHIVQPTEILLVVDAMLGQDSVNLAQKFNSRVGLTGIVLTKMDGDARGGAALSIGSITGCPVKFIGVGEAYDDLEVFYPERMASRILGMGDVLSLIEKAEKVVDQERHSDVIQKFQSREFTLNDFLQQLKQIRKLGPIDKILELLPNAGPLRGLNKIKVDEKELIHLEAIINSMTEKERVQFKIIKGSRRRRIARGSGRPISEVNRLLKQHIQMRKMAKKFSKQFIVKGLTKFNFPI